MEEDLRQNSKENAIKNYIFILTIKLFAFVTMFTDRYRIIFYQKTLPPFFFATMRLEET